VPQVPLERTPDILAEIGALNAGRAVLVGFAAETADVVGRAAEKLVAKGLDLVVANDVSGELGFGTDDNRVTLVADGGVEPLPVLSKRAIAREILDRVAQRLADRV
jgi:phosphopantothenoylcysteine decarboxylase/phosphopantothenate--cysteine ligase